MAPDPGSIGDWLNQSASEPGEVAGRYDEWAESYDADLASWSYRAGRGGRDRRDAAPPEDQSQRP